MAKKLTPDMALSLLPGLVMAKGLLQEVLEDLEGRVEAVLRASGLKGTQQSAPVEHTDHRKTMWTPERRAAQAARMKEIMRKRRLRAKKAAKVA